MHITKLQNNVLRFSLILLLFVSVNTGFMGIASSGAIVSVLPDSYSVGNGQDFNLSIYIEPDTPISGAQFDLTFDNSLVSVNSVQEGNLFKQIGSSTIFSSGSIDNANGGVTNVYGLILGKNMVEGPGTLAIIHLGSNNGSEVCEIQISNVIVSNSSGFSIPVELVNGKILIGGTSSLSSETISSGSGGGGGGGDAGEDYENIELKEISKLFVNSGSSISYQFNNSGNPVTHINYTALRSAGFITTTIEILENTSNIVSDMPQGKVYKNLNIWVGKHGYATNDNIDNPEIIFKVSKVWLEDGQIPVSTIKLNRHHSNTWASLPTVMINENADYVFFKAKTPGFSPFAITGQDSQTIQDTGDNFQDFEGILISESNNGGAINSAEDNEDARDSNYSTLAYVVGCIILVASLAVFLRKNK